MKRFMQNVGLFTAVAMAGLGTAVLPAATAQAAEPNCPQVVGVCTWTEPSFGGDMRILFDGEPVLTPPIRSAQNQDVQTWCFYERPFYDNQGQMREVNANETVDDFGFDAHSANQGQCNYDD
ncbi:peptidase inhibitor family I36 protein [Streptomyces sp. NPDC092903]|uniref:peptidase inhibitor family I36 protein n=1 Tax=Streptomyces sp. NPDC092903 TaxID=3366017 RepID=UPI00382D4735